MATYLYGLLLADDAPRVADDPGIAGTAVRVLDCGALAALVSTIGDRVKATLDTVRAHDAALQRYVDARATVAAVRFGQQFPSDADCRDHVIERSARVLALLRSHRGTVEMRVLLPMDPPTAAPVSAASPAPDVGKGTAYLEALRARTRAVTHVRLADAIGPMVLAEKVEELPASRGYSFAHLIQREHVAEYREAVTALPALSDARVVGPLALYSFAEADS